MPVSGRVEVAVRRGCSARCRRTVWRAATTARPRSGARVGASQPGPRPAPTWKGGEDPLLPHARGALEEAWRQERALELLWGEVGKDLGAGFLDGEPWPPLPDKPPEREDFYRTRLLELLREGE